MKVIVRFDAAEIAEIGTGHAVRAGIIANSLSALGHDVHALCRTKKEHAVVHKVLKSSLPILEARDESLVPNSSSESAEVQKHRPDLVIFDRLQTQSRLIQSLKDQNIQTVSFDDNGGGSLLTDLTFNSLVPSLKAPAPNLFEGYKYLISQALEALPGICSKKQIAISFGGYDHNRLSAQIIKTMNFTEFADYRFCIIVGNVEYKEELDRILTDRRINNCLIYVLPNNFYRLIAESSLAIVSGGLTLFDVIKLGVPSFAIAQYDHQKYNIQCLESSGLTEQLILSEDINPILKKKLNSTPDVKLTTQNILDNKGLERVLNVLKDKILR